MKTSDRPGLPARHERLADCEVEVYATPESAASALVSRLVGQASQAEASGDDFVLVAAGGTSLLPAWRMLSEQPAGAGLRRLQIFQTDEHAGQPHAYKENNYRLAWEEGKLGLAVGREVVRPDHVHRIITERRGEILDEPALVEISSAYETTLRQAAAGQAGPDLVILGMGVDGHTASIFPESVFPGSPFFSAPSFYRVCQYPQGRVPKSSLRVSMTMSGIRAARSVILVAFGKPKAEAVAGILTAPPDVRARPAAVVREVRGTLVVDEEAASRIPWD